MDDARQLRHARTDLYAATAALLDPTHIEITRDDGTRETLTGPPLLDRLRTGIRNSNGRPNGPTRTRPIPVSTDALALDAEIRDRVGTPVADRIRDWARNTAGSTDVDRATTVARCLWRWARAIHELLDPPKRWHLAAPCPACAARMVRRYDEKTAETVRLPALAVDGHTGCTCQACDEWWPPQHLEHLAKVLGCEPLDRHTEPQPA